MLLLFRRGGPGATGPVDEEMLINLYAHPAATGERPVRLRTNFVTTLDGSITGVDGRSGSINTPSDHHVFALHRALADVIMVGAGTVRTEGYRAVDLAGWQQALRDRLGLARYPWLVIISASGRIDPSVAEPAGGRGGPVMIITTEDRPARTLDPLRAAGVEVAALGTGSVDLGRVAGLLAGRGLTRVLCEGGPRLHRDLLAADLVDELSLTLAPLAVGGGGQRSTSGAPLPAPRGFVLEHALYAEDETLLTHYRRPAPER